MYKVTPNLYNTYTAHVRLSYAHCYADSNIAHQHEILCLQAHMPKL